MFGFLIILSLVLLSRSVLMTQSGNGCSPRQRVLACCLLLVSGGRIPLLLPVFVKDCSQVLKRAGLVQVGGMLLLSGFFWVQQSHAAQPRIVEVPAGPAFVQLPGAPEIRARSGQALQTNSLLKTKKTGRMQVLLDNGRQFRMGGDAQLRLGSTNVELLKGSMIGWIHSGASRAKPFNIKTRLATASIQGTTVFIEYSDDQLKVLSWEGTVTCETRTGQRYALNSGQQLLLDLNSQTEEVKDYLEELDADVLKQNGLPSGLEAGKELFPEPGSKEINEIKMNWKALKPIAAEEAEKRLEISPLITGFSKPIDTLAEIRRELGLMPSKQKLLKNDSSVDDQTEY